MFYHVHLLMIKAESFKENIMRRVTFFLFYQQSTSAKYFKETAEFHECDSVFFVASQYLCTVDVSFLESRLSSITNACKTAVSLKYPTRFRYHRSLKRHLNLHRPENLKNHALNVVFLFYQTFLSQFFHDLL